jgi:nucleotide-binding universal stress UspA family protein
MNTAKSAIVVAVGADDDSALAFALDEARRTERPLHIVHVPQLSADEARAGARDIVEAELADAVDQAAELAAGEVPVTGEVVDSGSEVDDLVHRGNVALLVVQHHALGRMRRMFAGSVAQGVVGRARVPVVSVPAGWTRDNTRPPVVTVGVQDMGEAPALLRVAFEQAQARKAALVVLHAWWLASRDDVVMVDPAFSYEWSGRSRHEIERVLEPLSREFPFVDVSVRVRRSPPLSAVLAATEGSDLVVLGRRHHLLPLGSHLGPVARGVLARSACPVMITPEPLATDPDLEHRPARLSSSAG